jgi:cytochrome c oxidase subunit 4
MNTRLYAVVFVVLFVAATAQVAVEFAGLDYWTGFGVILGLSAVKAVLVAAYFQHLRFEPRAVTYVVTVGLVAALALTLAAAYSITGT